MMANMPIVTPRRDKMVLKRFDLRALQANRKLSNICLKVIILYYYAIQEIRLVVAPSSELLKIIKIQAFWPGLKIGSQYS
jgi:hypothetical protein